VLSPTANVTQSIVSSGCKVHGTVENSVLSPGVIIEEGAIVRNSIVFHESIVKKDAVLDRVISDKDVVIGEATHVGVGDESIANEEIPQDENSGITVLGKEVHIGAHVQIGKNTLLYPGVSVQDNTEIGSGRVIR
jgi:glucose-1-phosphate adenylyltransferase